MLGSYGFRQVLEWGCPLVLCRFSAALELERLLSATTYARGRSPDTPSVDNKQPMRRWGWRHRF
jgi:hypothetical protein